MSYEIEIRFATMPDGDIEAAVRYSPNQRLVIDKRTGNVTVCENVDRDSHLFRRMVRGARKYI